VVFWVGSVRGVLVGNGDEAWDDIVIVRYSRFAALRRILESPHDPYAEPHRGASVGWDDTVMAQQRWRIPTRPAAPRMSRCVGKV
jgi:hypothetical protein